MKMNSKEDGRRSEHSQLSPQQLKDIEARIKNFQARLKNDPSLEHSPEAEELFTLAIPYFQSLDPHNPNPEPTFGAITH